MQNYPVYTFEILQVVVMPLFVLYIKGNWPLGKVIPCLGVIPILCGITQSWQILTMDAFPYLLDVVCFIIAIFSFRRCSSRNPFLIGLAFMLLCLRPACDFVFESIAFISGDRGDFYAIQQIIEPFAILSFILISIGLAVYSISSTLSHSVAFQNSRLGKITMKQKNNLVEKEKT